MKIKIYDWKKLLSVVLIGCAGLACLLVDLFRGHVGALLPLFIVGSLMCQGVYESVTEQGFRRGKARDERTKQAYRNRFGRFGTAVQCSPVIGLVLLVLLGLAQVPVWVLISGLVIELLYMIWLSIVIGSDLKK